MTCNIKQDEIDNFGKVAVSPYMTGEQVEETPAIIQGATKMSDVKIRQDDDLTWDEPNIYSPSRSMNTVVFQSKRGGNTIVINDEGSNGEGYMMIVHKSGSTIQIDENGTVLIKSNSDSYDTTQGIKYQKSNGDMNTNIGGNWNVMVEGGTGNIFLAGDLNIECENFDLKARGKATFSVAEAIEMKGSRVSIEAHSDNFDLLAKNVKISSSETFSLSSKSDMFLSSDDNMNIKSLAETRIESSDTLKMSGSSTEIFGSTVYIDDIVRMAESVASVSNADNAIAVKVADVVDPPSRRMSTNKNINKIYPTPTSISGRETDGKD